MRFTRTWSESLVANVTQTYRTELLHAHWIWSFGMKTNSVSAGLERQQPDSKASFNHMKQRITNKMPMLLIEKKVGSHQFEELNRTLPSSVVDFERHRCCHISPILTTLNLQPTSGANYCLYGYDTAAHLTEETKGADRTGPAAILSSIGIISVFGWAYYLALTFSIQDFNYLYDVNNETAGALVPAQIIYDAFHGRFLDRERFDKGEGGNEGGEVREKQRYTENKENYEKDLVEVRESEPVAVEDTNTAQQGQQPVSHSIVVSDDSTRLNGQEVQEVVPSVREQVVERELHVGNGVLLKEGMDNRVKVDLLSRSKQEKRELRKKLESELELVRSLVKKIEAKELQLSVGRLNHSRVVLVNDGVDRRLRRVNSEVGSVGVPRESTTPILTPTPRQSRPLNQLSISVLENSQGMGEFVEKEKRTPKANQFYRNSEFLLAKDKFPPAESNKKSKLNGKKQGAGESGFGFGTGTKIFKNCSALLDRLMKHKHGWVFNTPVDVKGLGLHDYFTIIKHPMDLGTVKSRLTKNWYKSPEEFAEDVRLTFHNAMKYNPKGQDVHVMAEQLLDIFETKWAVIKSDYDHEMRFASSYEVGIPTPPSRKAPPFVPPPLDMWRILDRSESMTYPIIDTRPKPITTTPSGRTPVPKKPKAKDPNKRDMTYDEKQKLSTNLQSLPSEKLDNIVQIIKKRSSALSQHDDEIEVDIDSVDVETLWELDRFVTNYKKSLSKNKRKAELAIQARADSQLNVQQKISAPVVVEAPKETKADERNVSTLSPNHVEKLGDNGSRSSSSSSSSSDSGSSSSDSDSDSSSASGSDAGYGLVREKEYDLGLQSLGAENGFRIYSKISWLISQKFRVDGYLQSWCTMHSGFRFSLGICIWCTVKFSRRRIVLPVQSVVCLSCGNWFLHVANLSVLAFV
ncbi:hypothetical protein POTOM_058482 [Populus tomentosa]|uniref:Global transcription factor group E4 n=1 Tax=Populus tomentosa TaxID=118781 RepID=A0A8X8C0S2_POPTO|nr:hypothetical protein POTOM_058482 [Populus tomentosa]